MPGYRSHLLFSLILFFGMRYIYINYLCMTCGILQQWHYMIAMLLGSLFPDIDIKSKGQLLFYKFFTIYLLLLMYQKKYFLMSTLSLIMMLPLIVHHRGLFHRWWFICFCAITILCIVYYLEKTLIQSFMPTLLFFVIGAFSHIFLDRITTQRF